MKVLVLGAGGYVGNVVCDELLACGYKVRAVDNFYKGQCDALLRHGSNPDFEFMFGDVTNIKDVKKAMDGINATIHLAGIVGFPACARNPQLSYAVNVQGTANVVECQPKEAPLIFSSTGSVYGKVEGVCDESSPTNPLSEYGLHKLEAEKIVAQHPSSLIYRFATAFGVSPCMRVNLLINDLVYQAYSTKSIVVFEADFRRTFIHVRDMAVSMIFGVQRQRCMKHKIYNIGSDNNNFTKRDIAEMIKAKTNCYVTYADIGKDLDQRDYAVSYAKINDEGWQSYSSVEEGVDELIKVAPLLQMRNPYS